MTQTQVENLSNEEFCMTILERAQLRRQIRGAEDRIANELESAAERIRGLNKPMDEKGNNEI